MSPPPHVDIARLFIPLAFLPTSQPTSRRKRARSSAAEDSARAPGAARAGGSGRSQSEKFLPRPGGTPRVENERTRGPCEEVGNPGGSLEANWLKTGATVVAVVLSAREGVTDCLCLPAPAARGGHPASV